MRTNIDIDESLITSFMEISGARTKREAVQLALEEAFRRRRQLAVLDHAGIGWDGDLDAMRLDGPVV